MSKRQISMRRLISTVDVPRKIATKSTHRSRWSQRRGQPEARSTGGYGRAGSGGDAYEVKTDDRSGSKLLIFVRPKRHDFPRDIYRSGEFSCAPEADRLKQRSMIMARVSQTP